MRLWSGIDFAHTVCYAEIDREGIGDRAKVEEVITESNIRSFQTTVR